MKLIPYLPFQGNCEEALNTYKRIFNGETGIINRYDNPNMDVPEAYKQKILHTELTFGDNTIMFADVMPGHPVNHGSGIALSITFDTLEETMSVFNQLSEIGDIIVPLEIQFWGSWFGEVIDCFGIKWMLMFNPNED